MRFVIVTGMSGSGKITALKILEDSGYYCADNLPIELIGTFADLVYSQTSEVNRVAIGVDIRSGQNLGKINKVLEQMKNKGQEYEILFLDCSKEMLIKRFKETRRAHPMGENKSVAHGIKVEQERLAFLREQADYIIDTSNLLVRDLRVELEKIFVQSKGYKNLFISVLSFGFKHGIPTDCDLVFDVRFLPNPYYEPELKHKTGLDREVQEFVLNADVTQVFLEKLIDMVRFLIPNYIAEGKNQLVIGIGCTGGRHRSVTISNLIYDDLVNRGYRVVKKHRDSMLR